MWAGGDERTGEGTVFERFTERARQVVVLAQDEARLGPTKGFTTFDLSAGFGKNNWTVEAFAQNLFDD